MIDVQGLAAIAGPVAGLAALAMAWNAGYLSIAFRAASFMFSTLSSLVSCFCTRRRPSRQPTSAKSPASQHQPDVQQIDKPARGLPPKQGTGDVEVVQPKAWAIHAGSRPQTHAIQSTDAHVSLAPTAVKASTSLPAASTIPHYTPRLANEPPGIDQGLRRRRTSSLGRARAFMMSAAAHAHDMARGRGSGQTVASSEGSQLVPMGAAWTPTTSVAGIPVYPAPASSMPMAQAMPPLMPLPHEAAMTSARDRPSPTPATVWPDGGAASAASLAPRQPNSSPAVIALQQQISQLQGQVEYLRQARQPPSSIASAQPNAATRGSQ